MMGLPKEILAELLKTEGGYSNDPADAGAETYCGVSRRFHPSWDGWSVIDKIKAAGGHPESGHGALDVLVGQFYQSAFWDRMQGDNLYAVAPKVAAELFDTAVNQGVHRAVSFLQRALNVLNRCGALYPDLSEDGVMGGKSLAALSTLLKTDPERLAVKVLNVMQGAHYLAYMKENSAQEKFARGWFGRVAI